MSLKYLVVVVVHGARVEEGREPAKSSLVFRVDTYPESYITKYTNIRRERSGLLN